MTGRHSYHLLGAALGAPDARPSARFAWSVAGVVDGFQPHDHYLQLARQAAQRPPASTVIERHVGELIELDANPVARLMRTSSDAPRFRQRWNGFNRLAPLGVETLVSDTPTHRLHRHAHADDTHAGLRAEVTATCVAQLLSRVSRPHAHEEESRPLMRNLRQLGLDTGGFGALVESLHEEPAASLDACAKATGSSRRTLQRELLQAGLGFARLRQAVRITLAAKALSDSTGNLADVAQSAGFFDSAHLAHAWKRACGLSLSQYRSLVTTRA